MDPSTIHALHDFFEDFGEEIEDVTLHGNTSEDRAEMAFYKSEENEEWYEGNHQWHYVGDVTILIRSVSPRSWSVGWNNANSPDFFEADIWGS